MQTDELQQPIIAPEIAPQVDSNESKPKRGVSVQVPGQEAPNIAKRLLSAAVQGPRA